MIARLTTLQGQVFRSQMEWLEHLARCSINIFDRPLLQTLNEAATWGAIRHHGLMENTVVVSDDAGQFRVAQHALCWVHAERHLQKLMPASPKQAKAVELVRKTIWCFYRGLKLWKQSPCTGRGGVIPAPVQPDLWPAHGLQGSRRAAGPPGAAEGRTAAGARASRRSRCTPMHPRTTCAPA